MMPFFTKGGDILANEVLRQEHKFLISIDECYRYRMLFRQLFKEDKYAKGKDCYEVRSLYFDSIDDNDFTEKLDGVYLRKKIRLRTYGSNSNFALLEMKQKQGDLQKKRSLKMSKEDAIQLIKGNYAVLLNYSDPFSKECYAIMTMHCYRPISVVSYHRKAFYADGNKTRITLDYNIVANECNFDIFSPTLSQYSVLNPHLALLEVKYNGFLQSYLKDVINTCMKSQSSMSKYCLARTVSKHYLF